MAENPVKQPYQLVVIGGSAGSLDVTIHIINALRRGISASLVIVLHRKTSNDTILVDLLATKTSLPVKEAEEKELIRPGHIYIVPADYHLLIEKNQSFSLDDSEKVNYSRPSIDVSFESAADVYGPSLIGILLSGANNDGMEGLKKIKGRGGLAIVQEPGSAGVAYMPEQAIKHVDVDIIADASAIGGILNELLDTVP